LNSKFQIAIFDTDKNEVGRSKIVDFSADAIDFGSFMIDD
jgi:hypothetical protein